MEQIHNPVLLKESADLLITNTDGVYFDGTIGFGGHAQHFLSLLSAKALYLGTDSDITAFEFCKEKFAGDNRVKLFNFNFSRVDTVAKISSTPKVDGVFADLGVSSYQFDDPKAGFTYRTESVLDLRLDKSNPLTAEEVVNTLGEEELVRILREYGEERNAKLIARRIVEKRKSIRITTTKELAAIVEDLTPVPYRVKSLSRVFQALRIYVNDELQVLKEFLQRGLNALKPGGRIAVISYHSLEDRIVKEFLRQEERPCTCPSYFPICTCGKKSTVKIVTRKPVTPSEEELQANRRSRSAKLRVAEKL